MPVSPVSSYKPITHPRKSVGQQLAGDVVFLLAACFMAWLVARLVDFILSPFQTTPSWKGTRKKIDADFDRRKAARERRQEAVDLDESDPMHQFQERFLTNPEKYMADSDNAVYYAWYKEWIAGGIIDTVMRWAPFIEDPDTGTVAGNFLDYLNIQVQLHKKVSVTKRMMFLLNVHRCYPELTPTIKGLEEDIVAYRGEVLERGLHSELHNELVSQGLEEDIAEYLENADMPAGRMAKAVRFFLDAKEHGCESDVAICMYEEGVGVEDPMAIAVTKILGELKLGRKITHMYLTQQLFADDIEYIWEHMEESKEFMGDALDTEAPEGGTYHENFLEKYSREALAKRNLEKVGKACKTSRK